MGSTLHCEYTELLFSKQNTNTVDFKTSLTAPLIVKGIQKRILIQGQDHSIMAWAGLGIMGVSRLQVCVVLAVSVSGLGGVSGARMPRGMV